MFKIEDAERRAREEQPLLEEAHKKAEEVVERYVDPLVKFFNQLESDLQGMYVASRFSRTRKPNLDYFLGTPHPSLEDLSEADFKRQQLILDLQSLRTKSLSISAGVRNLMQDALATQQEDFVPGKALNTTDNFRVVMDWKPGLEGQKDGGRYFIEPKTDVAEQMLLAAAHVHRILNFDPREVEGTKRQCLRADFSVENIGPLFMGQVIVPEEGKDSVPSPQRMEECLKLHPYTYSFKD